MRKTPWSALAHSTSRIVRVPFHNLVLFGSAFTRTDRRGAYTGRITSDSPSFAESKIALFVMWRNKSVLLKWMAVAPYPDNPVARGGCSTRKFGEIESSDTRWC